MTDFKLKRPCPKCPFVKGNGYLHRERARQIATDVANGSSFACHQTTSYDEESNDMYAGEGAQFCAGALIMMEKQDAPNQQMRIAERLGVYDPSGLDMEAPVCETTLEFIRMHGEDEPVNEYASEPCSIAEAGCEAPAGYLINGVVVDAEIEAETTECEGCGAYVCENCAPYCYCHDE